MKPIRRISIGVIGLAGLLILLVGNAGIGAQEIAPLGPLPDPPKPKPEQAALGKLLFFDDRISADSSFSCVKCHDPKKGWTDGAPLAEAYPGTLSPRNAPTILNTAYYKKLHWDGSQGDLPTVIRTHVTGPMFMNADTQMTEERLRQIPEYQEQWKGAFGNEYTVLGQIFNALAAFVQTQVSTDVPFDKYMKGDKAALSSQAQKGLELFQGKAGCIQCHNGPLLTDQKYYNLGVPANPDILANPLRRVGLRFINLVLGVPDYDTVTQDYGRYIPSKMKTDKGAFRTPQLREVKYTAPYMHNGMLKTLDEVVEFYDRGGGPDPFGTKSPNLKPLGLSSDEEKALVAFLSEGLSSPTPITMEKPKIPEYKLREVKTWMPPKDDFSGGGSGLPFIK